MAATRVTPTKYVFVTGGVSSSLGKGITAASLGRLLVARGLRVRTQKLDPYLNVDPGTLNPIEHGEVFVTTDGGETDLDLGHYERFVGVELTRDSSVTTGSVYAAVLAAERRGEYLGRTVQVIPHITDEIKRRITALGADADVVICEVGGTVGDIEILPFLEAIRQLRNEVGRDHVACVHVTLVPYLGPSGELKTKPTQHSVTELRSRGLAPDVIVARADRVVPTAIKTKIANLCDVDVRAVIAAADDPHHLYRIPLAMHADGFDDVVCARLGLPTDEPDLREWAALVARIDAATASDAPAVEVGIVGKYTELGDAYLSVVEAISHAGWASGVRPRVRFVDAELLAAGNLEEHLGGLQAVVIPGGFGERGVEGKIAAAGWCRAHRIPTLGLCLGLQVMVIDAARNLAGLHGAHSSEFAPGCAHPVVALMDDQHRVTELGGTMRLGAYPAVLTPGSRVADAYGATVVSERHRHRYEVNPAYRAVLEDAGLAVVGTSPDGTLVEFVELVDHPFYAATQAHPEFTSRPDAPAPLFAALIAAACGAGHHHAECRTAIVGC